MLRIYAMAKPNEKSFIKKKKKNMQRSDNSYSLKAWLDFGNGKKYYFRSSWERNYARYLQWLKNSKKIKEWAYEPKRFMFPEKRGNNSYLPDFLVTENDNSKHWVEIKGYMDKSSEVKLNRFRKYYPDEYIMLIDKDIYRKLSSQLKNLIEGWE